MLYTTTLFLHNILRWVALILVLAATVSAILALFTKREWTETDRKFGLFSTIALDIQILLGLLLYVVLSPITKAAFQDFGAAMGVADLRFFAIEHVFYMVIAVIFAHLGSALPKKVEASNAKFKRAAIFLGIALIALLLGIPWSRPLFPALF